MKESGKIVGLREQNFEERWMRYYGMQAKKIRIGAPK
jgi:hypothetical protein